MKKILDAFHARRQARQHAQNQRDAALNSSRAPVHEWRREEDRCTDPLIEALGKIGFYLLMTIVLLALVVEELTGPLTLGG